MTYDELWTLIACVEETIPRWNAGQWQEQHVGETWWSSRIEVVDELREWMKSSDATTTTTEPSFYGD